MLRGDRDTFKRYERRYIDNGEASASYLRSVFPMSVINERLQELTSREKLLKILDFSCTFYLNIGGVVMLLGGLGLSSLLMGIAPPIAWTWTCNLMIWVGVLCGLFVRKRLKRVSKAKAFINAVNHR